MVIPRHALVALNPLQWFATGDGWLDWQLSPPLGDLFAQIKSAGFDAVATRLPEGMAASTYVQVAHDAGLSLAPGTTTIRLADDGDDAPTLEAITRLTDAYGELGLPSVFIFPGMIPDAPRVAHPARGFEASPERMTRLADLLVRAGEIATAGGVMPILHPHVGTWVETEAETRALLDAVPPNLLGFGPDLGHLSWAGADVVCLIREYRTRIRGIHVKDLHQDVARRSRAEDLTYRQTVMAGLWTEPGRGDLDYEAIWAALGEDFSGAIVIEVDRGALDPPLESARACAQWVRSSREPGAAAGRG